MGLVGAITGLMDAGYSTYRVSGVSVGSVVAAIAAAASRGGAGPVPILGSACLDVIAACRGICRVA